MDAAEQGSLADRLGGDDAAKFVAALPDVDAAFVAGANGSRLYAAIAAARRRVLPDERRAIDEVLRRRRAFAEPLRGTPSLFTLNGIGSRLYGTAEPDPHDGTSIATLFLTFVYLPILPLSSYVVRPGEGSVFRRSFQFFAKVPLSRAHRIWRWTALAALVLCLCAVAESVRHARSHSRVRVVNGLDVAVTTTLGGATLTVQPGRIESVELAAGRHHVSTRTAAGESVEELDVDAPGATDVVAYNVLGAAPIRVAEIIYVATGSTPSTRTPEIEDFAGSPFVTRDHVDYVFVTPPERKQMSGKTESRHCALLLDGGWKAGVSVLLGRNERSRAIELACRVALLERTDDAISFAAGVSFMENDRRLLRFSEEAIDHAPGSIEAHRAYQSAMERLGRNEELRARYREEYDRQPTSASAGYLYARTLSHVDALPLLEKLVNAHPVDSWCRRSIAWHLFMTRRFAEAVTHFQKLDEIDPRTAEWALTSRVQALVGAGRTPEAERIARSAVSSGNWDVVVTCARLARLPDADQKLPAATTLLSSIPRGTFSTAKLRALLAAAARDPRAFEVDRSAIDEQSLREACRLMLLCLSDLEAATSAAADAPAEVVQGLDAASCLALACECVRSGRTPRAKEAFERKLAPFTTLDALKDLAGPLADEDIDLDLHAVLEYAASRRAADPAERDRLLADARTDDLLRCFVPR